MLKQKTADDDDEYHPADLAGLKTQGCTSAIAPLMTRPGYTEFLNAVNNRDGGRCRFTGDNMAVYLQKAHLVPHSKGFKVRLLNLGYRGG